jgi:hypothetical protein
MHSAAFRLEKWIDAPRLLASGADGLRDAIAQAAVAINGEKLHPRAPCTPFDAPEAG